MRAANGLPFVVRLYFYAGTAPVRMVHTIVFDGDHETDFNPRPRRGFLRAHARTGAQPSRPLRR
jgi:hypothetical protein